jgi:hypothetical protein
METYNQFISQLRRERPIGSSKPDDGRAYHLHHIWPKHASLEKGHCINDDPSNLIWLCIDTDYNEHAYAHFLLWVRDGRDGDLRAFNLFAKGNAARGIEIARMNGLNSYENRLGIFSEEFIQIRREEITRYVCDNKLGFHDPKYDNLRKDWSHRGGVTAGNQSAKDRIGIHNPKYDSVRKEWAINAGKGNLGKFRNSGVGFFKAVEYGLIWRVHTQLSARKWDWDKYEDYMTPAGLNLNDTAKVLSKLCGRCINRKQISSLITGEFPTRSGVLLLIQVPT